MRASDRVRGRHANGVGCVLMLQRLRALLMLAVALVCVRVLGFYRKERPTWLVCERRDEARDNGYHFFRYVRQNHPEVNVRYVIERGSADRTKVERLGPVIDWGSFQHYLAWVAAACAISAHPGACAPDPNFCWRARRAGLVKFCSANLRHGVIGSSFPDYMLSSNGGYHMLVASAPREYAFLVHELGHDEDVVQLTGLCRFDELHREVAARRQVLLMPTWRRFFRATGDRSADEKRFIASAYFRFFQGFLGSSQLRDVLVRHGYSLVFFPHYELQRYLHLFDVEGEAMSIADREAHDVQSLLMESRVLVTDYSSVSFDFAYMHKPVVYALPDDDEFFAGHFERGYFRPDRDGFGPVVREPDDAVREINMLLARDGELDAGYRSKVDAFFQLRDARNCERNYAAVADLVARRRGDATGTP